jgi:hypothetical protein
MECYILTCLGQMLLPLFINVNTLNMPKKKKIQKDVVRAIKMYQHTFPLGYHYSTIQESARTPFATFAESH